MLDVVWLPTEHLGINVNSFRKCPCIPAWNLNLALLGFEPGELFQELLGGVCGTISNIIGNLFLLTKNSKPYYWLEP